MYDAVTQVRLLLCYLPRHAFLALLLDVGVAHVPHGHCFVSRGHSWPVAYNVRDASAVPMFVSLLQILRPHNAKEVRHGDYLSALRSRPGAW